MVQLKDTKKELKELKQEIEGCQQKIRKIDQLIAKGVKRLDYTQKFFMDIIRVACAHIDNDVMKILSQYYKNRRDIFKMIDRILSTGGYIEKDSDGGLIVTLSKLNTEKENEAMELFIEHANQQNPTMLFDKSKKIVFK